MFTTGQKIYFKREVDRRLLKGTILNATPDGWLVQGARTATNIKPPVHILQTHEITTDHIPLRQRVKKLETGHGTGLSIPVAESIRRKEIATARLGISEAEVLQARSMLEIRRRALRYLASTNGIVPNTTDFEFEELSGEYLVATLSALRSTASKATDADIIEFRRYLQGEVTDSRMMMTITRTSRTAAVRYLKARAQYHRHHVDIHEVEYRLAA